MACKAPAWISLAVPAASELRLLLEWRELLASASVEMLFAVTLPEVSKGFLEAWLLCELKRFLAFARVDALFFVTSPLGSVFLEADPLLQLGGLLDLLFENPEVFTLLGVEFLLAQLGAVSDLLLVNADVSTFLGNDVPNFFVENFDPDVDAVSLLAQDAAE